MLLTSKWKRVPNLSRGFRFLKVNGSTLELFRLSRKWTFWLFVLMNKGAFWEVAFRIGLMSFLLSLFSGCFQF